MNRARWKVGVGEIAVRVMQIWQCDANMAMCFEILIFFGRSMSFIAAKSRTCNNHVFSRFNHSSIVTYVINNR